MKFKVGELVRVRKNLVVGRTYGTDTFVKEMKNHKGKIFNIIKITKSGKYYLEGCGWYCFTDEMLEEANPNDFIKQFLDKNKKVFKKFDVNFSVTPKSQILDQVEKRYLSAVIRPFRDRILCIVKSKAIDCEYEYIEISVKSIYGGVTDIEFPLFKANTMYKGMKVNREYTLDQLDL